MGEWINSNIHFNIGKDRILTTAPHLCIYLLAIGRKELFIQFLEGGSWESDKWSSGIQNSLGNGNFLLLKIDSTNLSSPVRMNTAVFIIDHILKVVLCEVVVKIGFFLQKNAPPIKSKQGRFQKPFLVTHFKDVFVVFAVGKPHDPIKNWNVLVFFMYQKDMVKRDSPPIEDDDFFYCRPFSCCSSSVNRFHTFGLKLESGRLAWVEFDDLPVPSDA